MSFETNTGSQESGSQTNENEILPSAAGVNWVKAEVVFGAPSMGCAGAGICKIIANGLNIKQTCTKVSALIAVTEPGSIIMQFSKKSMKPRFEAFHFRERVFRVQESFLLPEFLLVQLALNSAPYLINPGIYPVKEHDDWMIVIF